MGTESLVEVRVAADSGISDSGTEKAGSEMRDDMWDIKRITEYDIVCQRIDVSRGRAVHQLRFPNLYSRIQFATRAEI